MKVLIPIVVLVLAVGCVTHLHKPPPSHEGLDAAEKDIKTFKVALKSKTPEELVQAFIPANGPRYYGGYEYFFRAEANIAIREELEARGTAAYPALTAHREDRTRIWEYINGPGNTVGHICTRLLEKGPNDAVEPTRAPSGARGSP